MNFETTGTAPTSLRSGNARLMIIAVLAAVVLGAGVLALRRASQAASLEQSHSAAVHFVKQIQAEEIDAAWEGTTAEFKSFIGRDRLHQIVASNSAWQEPFELVDCRPADVQQLTLLECLFRSAASPESRLRILLASEGGEWKVERLYLETGDR